MVRYSGGDALVNITNARGALTEMRVRLNHTERIETVWKLSIAEDQAPERVRRESLAAYTKVCSDYGFEASIPYPVGEILKSGIAVFALPLTY
jgi:hypothetical protein